MANSNSSLKYTLREIVIVIIGISIAFSINKCAENSKDNRLKKQYLTNLKSDIEADRIQLNENIEQVEIKLKACGDIIPLLNTGAQKDMRLMQDVFTILEYRNFTPKDITYQTLINSGDFKLIDDFNLKASIQRHYSNYDELQGVYARHLSIIQDYLGNYLVNHADYDQIQQRKSPFLDEIKLKNIVRAMLTTFNDKKTASEKGVQSCDSIITEIGKALD
ncbi:MAG: DUF6090 family protein [Bacteroidota bacterium]